MKEPSVSRNHLLADGFFFLAEIKNLFKITSVLRFISIHINTFNINKILKGGVSLDTIRLSRRLLAVASFVEYGAFVADIGSDHAYLPTYLIKCGIAQKAIAGEVADGPYQSARNNVVRQGVMDSVSVRLANGLFAIEESDEVDTVTIAGMGGSLIVTILDSGKTRLKGVRRIIAQPNLHAKAIREWAVANGWEIVNEKILKEDGKIYEILVLEKGEMKYDELEILVGPFLLVERNDAFREKWTNEMTQWHQVLKSIENASETTETLKKIEQLTRNIDIVGKALAE